MFMSAISPNPKPNSTKTPGDEECYLQVSKPKRAGEIIFLITVVTEVSIDLYVLYTVKHSDSCFSDAFEDPISQS